MSDPSIVCNLKSEHSIRGSIRLPFPPSPSVHLTSPAKSLLPIELGARVSSHSRAMGGHRSLMGEGHSDGLSQDFQAFAVAGGNLMMHTAEQLKASWTTDLLLWIAVTAAIYLLVLDRTNWRTNFLTALLVPYLYINLHDAVFYWFYNGWGKWFAFIAVVVKLFFPRNFPDWLELPASLIVLIVVSPTWLAHYGRHSVWGTIVSLAIGVYLGYEHINAAGGFRAAFAEKKGIPVTVGIIVLSLAPFFELLGQLGIF